MSFETAVGRVVGLRDGESPGQRVALIAVEPVAACRRCMEGRGCGAGLLYASGTTEIAIPAPSGLVLVPGDIVELRLPAAALLRVALLAYGLPLAGLLLAATGAALAGASQLTAVVAAGAGALAGVLSARRRLSLTCPQPLKQLELAVPRAQPEAAA